MNLAQYILAPLAALLFATTAAAQIPDELQGDIRTERVTIRLEMITDQLQRPWGIAFLSGNKALVSQRRPSTLSIVDLENGSISNLDNVPEAYAQFDAGMRDIALHPQFDDNGWIYFSYSSGSDEGSTLVVDRARLKDNALVERQNIYTLEDIANWDLHFYHYGARLRFHEGYLFISVGDRHKQDTAQDLGLANGSFLRLNDDGSIPADNPFVNREGARPEIWSYGHRNPQGFSFHPQSGALWSTEHGPLGADEINLVERGKNYGWPVITHGLEYDSTVIGEGISRKAGMEQPVFYYTPSVAPSDLEFYTGERFAAWQNSLFFGSMSRRHLRRVELEADRVIHEEILLADLTQRIRFVRQGPDGMLYVGTDDGWLFRIVPAK